MDTAQSTANTTKSHLKYHISVFTLYPTTIDRSIIISNYNRQKYHISVFKFHLTATVRRIMFSTWYSTIGINCVDSVEARKIFQVTITFWFTITVLRLACFWAMGRHKGSQHRHGQTQGVTVQPWADTRGSQYGHGQTQGVTIQSWADIGGHNTVIGRHGGSEYSQGQTQGVTIQPWADTGGPSVPRALLMDSFGP